MHVSLDELVLFICCVWLLFEIERRNWDEKKVQSSRAEKSLRNIAVVTKFLNDNKPKTSLKK